MKLKDILAKLDKESADKVINVIKAKTIYNPKYWEEASKNLDELLDFYNNASKITFFTHDINILILQAEASLKALIKTNHIIKMKIQGLEKGR